MGVDEPSGVVVATDPDVIKVLPEVDRQIVERRDRHGDLDIGPRQGVDRRRVDVLVFAGEELALRLDWEDMRE